MPTKSNPFQPNDFQVNPDPTEPPQAEIIEIVEQRGGKRFLVLQVKIGDQPRRVLLALDALEDHGLSGPAAVEELREIRKLLASTLEPMIRHSNEIASFLDVISRHSGDIAVSMHANTSRSL